MTLTNDTSRYQAVTFYLDQGYSEVKNNRSGQGANILSNGSDIIRISDDFYHHDYIMLIKNKCFKGPNVVRVYEYEYPKGIPSDYKNPDDKYTITRMELLKELDENEARKYSDWINITVLELSSNKPISSDFFGLANVAEKLYRYASCKGYTHDYQQAKNIMKRASDGFLVYIDPFTS